MIKLKTNSIAVWAVAVAAALTACTQSGTRPGGGVETVGVSTPSTTGSVGAALTLAPGVNLYSLSWTISNGTNTYVGTVNIGDAQTISWVAGGIAAGTGYRVTVSGTDTNGGTVSGTSSTFTVTAGGLITVSLSVSVVDIFPNDATVAADVQTGSVEVNGTVTYDASTQAATNCPGISSFSITPAAVLVGQPAALSVSTIGPAAAVTWSATPSTAGTFSPSATAASPTFTATTANTNVTITVTIGLPDSGACTGVAFTTLSGSLAVGGTTAAGDSGAPDTGVAETGAPDTGVAETGVVEAGPDAVADSAPPPALHPRIAATDTVNSVNCDGNASGICTPTEAVLVQIDINKGTITTPGNSESGSAGCYESLWNAGIIDDTVFGDTGKECGDHAGNFTGADGGAATDTFANLCVATLTCEILGAGAGCALTNGGVDNCYCGSGGGSPSLCSSAGSATNGLCKTAETNGLKFDPNDSLDILKNFTDTSEPSGVANNIIAGAAGNSFTQCLQ